MINGEGNRIELMREKHKSLGAEVWAQGDAGLGCGLQQKDMISFMDARHKSSSPAPRPLSHPSPHPQLRQDPYNSLHSYPALPTPLPDQ